ncbi:hypothetical protein AC579_1846 [Pseudocercospora musae]|uniref:C2H2-type domain-containing protein n=1 Tax=Pseudocercospora musae TaxID=113226 RepID=A0A139I701_9PEZI|nr:hypothetical protein AC579_1846 [Pseudocercospora musae]
MVMWYKNLPGFFSLRRRGKWDVSRASWYYYSCTEDSLASAFSRTRIWPPASASPEHSFISALIPPFHTASSFFTCLPATMHTNNAHFAPVAARKASPLPLPLPLPLPGNLARTATEHTMSDYDLDEFIHSAAYHEATPDLEPTPSLQLPSPAHSFDSVLTPTPTPTPPYAEPPYTVPATSARHVAYFPPAADVDPLERSASNCKKRPSRTLTGLSALMPLTKKRSQRQKKIENGFPCRESCGQCFHRECDERKHYERRHLSEEHWPHECTRCPKKFQYPKDVWRHLLQTHGMVVPPKGPKSPRPQLGCPCCSQTASDWLEEHNDPHEQYLHIHTHTVQPPVTNSTPSSPTSPNILWTLTNAITKLRRLSLKSKQDKFIMVTTDRQNFTEVDVSGIHTEDALLARIASTLAFDDQRAHDISLHKYTRRSVGDRLTGEALLSVITQYADAEGSLKLFVKP